MLAMVLDAYGVSPHAVDRAIPSPGAQQALVRVRASSVNPIDWKQASGAYRPILSAKMPGFVPGYDLAGEVEAVGAAVTSFVKGQRVHTRLTGTDGGASAEYVVAGLDVLRPMPEKMSFDQAAGLPLAGMTALQGLRDQCALPLTGATQRVLIIGASGGVGHLAVQIAKSMGATVVAVCSGRNAERVKRLGADDVIDYTKPDPYAGKGRFDAIFDAVGSAAGDFLPLLEASGRFASCVPGPSIFARSALNVVRSKKVLPVLLRANAADLALLDALFEKGALEVLIDSRFPARELSAAWARSRSGRAAGKVIVEF